MFYTFDSSSLALAHTCLNSQSSVFCVTETRLHYFARIAIISRSRSSTLTTQRYRFYLQTTTLPIAARIRPRFKSRHFDIVQHQSNNQLNGNKNKRDSSSSKRKKTKMNEMNRFPTINHDSRHCRFEVVTTTGGIVDRERHDSPRPGQRMRPLHPVPNPVFIKTTLTLRISFRIPAFLFFHSFNPSAFKNKIYIKPDIKYISI